MFGGTSTKSFRKDEASCREIGHKRSTHTLHAPALLLTCSVVFIEAVAICYGSNVSTITEKMLLDLIQWPAALNPVNSYASWVTHIVHKSNGSCLECERDSARVIAESDFARMWDIFASVTTGFAPGAELKHAVLRSPTGIAPSLRCYVSLRSRKMCKHALTPAPSLIIAENACSEVTQAEGLSTLEMDWSYTGV